MPPTRLPRRTLLLLLSAATTPALATDYYYVGPPTSSWSDPNNWSTSPTGPGGSGPPATNDNAIVSPTTPTSLTLDSTGSPTPTLGTLSLTGPLTLTQSAPALNAATLNLSSGATFLQPTGTNSFTQFLRIDDYPTPATYSLSGPTSALTAPSFSVAGTLAQSGGSLAATTSLAVTGTYSLTAGSVSTPTLFSIGTILQTGGSISALYGSQLRGLYALSGGTLSLAQSYSVGNAPFMDVFGDSLSTFAQSGGSVSIGDGHFASLAVGDADPGIYTLSAGSLSFNAPDALLTVGTIFSSSFIQSGGTVASSANPASSLAVVLRGATASYSLSAGTLTATSLTLAPTGSPSYPASATFSQSGGSATFDSVNLTPGPDATATLLQTGGTLSAYSLLLSSGTFTQSGGSTSLQNATIAGTLSASAGHFIANGNLYVNGTTASPALLSLFGTATLVGYLEQFIGATGPAVLNQTGGYNYSAGTLHLGGTTPAATASYSLSAGGASFGYLLLDNASVFQSGGTLSTYALFLSNDPGTTSTYSLSGGLIQLSSSPSDVGPGSAFIQTGGTLSLSSVGNLDALIVSSAATYSLSGAGLLTSPGTHVYGTFTQSGGTANTPLNLHPSARYTLSAGSLNTGYTPIDGTFVQSGGTFTGYPVVGPTGRYALAAGTLTGNVSVAGYLSQSGGTLTTPSLSLSPTGIYDLGSGSLSASNVSNAGVFFMSPSATFTLNSYSTFSNSGSATFDGTQQWYGTFVNTNTAIFRSDPGGPNVIADSPSGYSSITFDAPSAYIHSLTLLNQSRLYIAPAGWRNLFVLFPSIGPAAQIDVADNTLSIPFGNFDAIRQWILNKQIVSSFAGPATGQSLAYGYAPSGPGPGVPIVAINLTPTGDANLDGRIDADDYALLDRSFVLHLSDPHWTDGDFNYDGVVNQDDYLLIDTAYFKAQGSFPGSLLTQRDAQFGPDYVAALLASLPEPAPALACLIAALPLTRRRRPGVTTSVLCDLTRAKRS